MTDKAFAQADPEWLALISAARGGEPSMPSGPDELTTTNGDARTMAW